MIDIDATKRESEERLYIIVRKDLEIDSFSIAAQAASIAWLCLDSQKNQFPHTMSNYDQNGQPKIVLGAHNLGQINRVKKELEALNINYFEQFYNGESSFLSIGPIQKNSLPKFVQKLPLMSNTPIKQPIKETSDLNQKILWVFVRTDIEIPEGKLISQVSHACWSTTKANSIEMQDQSDTLEWNKMGRVVICSAVSNFIQFNSIIQEAEAAGLIAQQIVDAGRTVFDKPTQTVIGVGPCTFEALPQYLADLTVYHEQSGFKP